MYGLDYVMSVRDYAALEGLELVPFDVEFDHARAVKSDAELESVRESVRINEEGFEIFFEQYGRDRPAAEAMAAAEDFFVTQGCGRLTMNMVLTGPNGKALPEFKIARKDELLGDFMLPSLEVAGPGMHWVEVSRAIAVVGRCLERCDTGDDGRLRGVLRGCGGCDARRVRPHTTCTGRWRRDSSTAATSSGTSPGTRSG